MLDSINKSIDVGKCNILGLRRAINIESYTQIEFNGADNSMKFEEDQIRSC